MLESNSQQNPHSKTGMLIRRPIEQVFEALIDPTITSKFWFTTGSGRLEQGKSVLWHWAMYDVEAEVTPIVVQPSTHLVIKWPSYSGQTEVAWALQAQAAEATYLEVSECGFTGTLESIRKQIVDSTEGFCLVLAGLKAWLEHGITLNLVADRFPTGYHDKG